MIETNFSAGSNTQWRMMDRNFLIQCPQMHFCVVFLYIESKLGMMKISVSSKTDMGVGSTMIKITPFSGAELDATLNRSTL
jgi:hypothetical protein